MVYEIAKRCTVGHKLADQLRADTLLRRKYGWGDDRGRRLDFSHLHHQARHQGQDEVRPPGAGRVYQLTM